MAKKVKKAPGGITRFQPLFVPLAILLGGVAIVIVITGGLGRLSPPAEGPVPTGDSGLEEVQVSVGDDPSLGDPNAPLTIVEFSDYKCPFCKIFFEETFPQIKAQYIDTGKLRFVYRDLPLGFNEPAAAKGALAANCARDQKGDSGYFQYHSEIFARTPSGGQRMPEADYVAAASQIGLDVAAFNLCLSSEKFKDEIQADLDYVLELAQRYPTVFPRGIATPAFFIGRSDPSGTFTAQVVLGAQPFENFQQVIETLLE